MPIYVVSGKRQRGVQAIEYLERLLHSVDNILKATSSKPEIIEMWEEEIIHSSGGKQIENIEYNIPSIISKLHEISENKEMVFFTNIEFLIRFQMNNGNRGNLIIHNDSNYLIYGRIEIQIDGDDYISFLRNFDSKIGAEFCKLIENEKIIVNKIVSGPGPDAIDIIEGHYRYYKRKKDIVSDLLKTFEYKSLEELQDRYQKIFSLLDRKKIIQILNSYSSFEKALTQWGLDSKIQISKGSFVFFSEMNDISSFYNVFEKNYIDPLEEQIITSDQYRNLLIKPLEKYQ